MPARAVRRCVNALMNGPIDWGVEPRMGPLSGLPGGYKSFRSLVVVVFVGSHPSSQLSPSPLALPPTLSFNFILLASGTLYTPRPSSATTNPFHTAPSPTLYPNPLLHLVTPRSPCRSAGTTSGCPFCSTIPRVPLSCAYPTISCD